MATTFVKDKVAEIKKAAGNRNNLKKWLRGNKEIGRTTEEKLTVLAAMLGCFEPRPEPKSLSRSDRLADYEFCSKCGQKL